MSARGWQRIGAAAGVLWFVVVVITFFLPATPDADDPTPQIVRELADDRGALNVGTWLLGVGAVLFVVFSTALWSRLRDAEPHRGPSTLVLLGGLGSSLIVLVAAMIGRAMTEAAGEGRDPAAVRALFELSGSSSSASSSPRSSSTPASPWRSAPSARCPRSSGSRRPCWRPASRSARSA